MSIKSFFSPPPPAPRLPEQKIQELYPLLRYKMLEATFIGYTFFYFVRNNLPVVATEMGDDLGYTKSDIGNLFAGTAIAYGLGKFFMGSVSDRSNPRTFMSIGLILSAFINIAFGSISSYPIHLLLWTVNGFVQGMGWPPCGRTLGHWYSLKERGTVFAIWNIAHNVGGGLVGVIAAFAASKFGWQFAFYFPALLALICAYYLNYRLRDTPESLGLPPIEEYKNDYPPSSSEDSHALQLSYKTLLVDYVLKNKIIWLFAFGNFFVYIVRYSISDWGPTYLKEVKGATLELKGLSTTIYEFSGIVSTLLVGWLSDRFGGRRGMVSLLCMIPILFAFYALLNTPKEYPWMDYALFGVIGFFIYPPVMLLGVAGLDFTSKKAVGTAAGFIGLFGYLGRTFQGKVLGFAAEHYGWNSAISIIFVCCGLAILTLAFTWKLKPKS